MVKVGLTAIIEMADHVHIEHIHDRITPRIGLIDVVIGAVQARLLGVEQRKDEGHVGFDIGQYASHFEHPGRSGAVVVGGRRRCHAIPVGTHDHILVRKERADLVGQHIFTGDAYARHGEAVEYDGVITVRLQRCGDPVACHPIGIGAIEAAVE